MIYDGKESAPIEDNPNKVQPVIPIAEVNNNPNKNPEQSFYELVNLAQEYGLGEGVILDMMKKVLRGETIKLPESKEEKSHQSATEIVSGKNYKTTLPKSFVPMAKMPDPRKQEILLNIVKQLKPTTITEIRTLEKFIKEWETKVDMFDRINPQNIPQSNRLDVKDGDLRISRLYKKSNLLGGNIDTTDKSPYPHKQSDLKEVA